MSPKKNITSEKTAEQPTAQLGTQLKAKLYKGRQKQGTTSAALAETQHLINELQVNQIELELQNDQLAQRCAETEATLHEFQNLYDFAPLGYFTLARSGDIIVQVNLTGASLLGIERGNLIKRRFGMFVSFESRPVFSSFLERVFSEECGQESCEVELLKNGHIPIWVHIEATCSDSIQGQGEVCNAVVRDISEHKRVEDILQARLRITEFGAEHSLDDLLQNALDELCGLTHSPIGFFHFVEPDQITLSLQTWSTRTLKEMCTAEGKGQHYNIDQAGVWVDCVREGRPVIHNDYANLPASQRKGLPQGHAPIVREMVFPIMRNQKIVAIIGVGNKSVDYTEEDISYASRLADLIWDITDRKRAESQREAALVALRESEARYRSILEDQTELICRYLPDGRLSFVNEAYARYYSETAQRLINTNFIPNIPEPDISMVIGKILEITPQDSVVVYEHRIIKSDGEIRWQRWTHRGIYDASDKLIEHQAVGNDITERKQMESALATERGRLADILKGTNAGTWEWNVQSGQTIFNERWAEIIGYTLDELSPVSIDTWIKFTHPEDLNRSDELLEKHFKGELDYYEIETRMRHKNGYWVWVLDRGKVATWTEDGKPLLMSGTHQDISKRMHMEEALRMAEADYRAIFERAPVGIFRSTVEGRFVKANQAMADMYRYDLPEEMINDIDSIATQVYVDSSSRWKFQSLLADDNEVSGFITQNRRRDGSLFWVSTNARAVKNEKGEILYYEGFIENITARKQAEEQIQFLAKLPAEDPNPVLRVAQDGTLLYINEAGLNLLSQWNLQVGAAASPRLQEAVFQSMQNGKTQTIDLEYGDRLYAFYVAPIVSAHYANLYAHDITESRQVKALKDAEIRYHVLFEQSPYGILLVHPETGSVIEANEITSRQLGYTRDEFAGLKISDYEATEDPAEVAGHMQKIVGEGSDDFETLHRTKSGEIRNIHVWVKTLSLDDHVYFYTIFQDITERKRMEEANEAYSREITLLEERQRIASDLHDAVSQTLFSARLTAETLLRQPDRQSDVFTRSLMDLNRLVRSASGEIRLVLVELRNNALLNVSLNTLLVNLIDSSMARTNANLIFQCHVDDLVLPAQVKLAFYRIAQEAISNAIKHGKPANINCILREKEQTLEMIIADDGTGFSIDQVSDDHFGLQIMRERADQAGVDLNVSSQPGSGTSVTVSWKEEKP